MPVVEGDKLIEVRVPAVIARHLEALHATGLWGATVGDSLLALAMPPLREMVERDRNSTDVMRSYLAMMWQKR